MVFCFPIFVMQLVARLFVCFPGCFAFAVVFVAAVAVYVVAVGAASVVVVAAVTGDIDGE